MTAFTFDIVIYERNIFRFKKNLFSAELPFFIFLSKLDEQRLEIPNEMENSFFAHKQSVHFFVNISTYLEM